MCLFWSKVDHYVAIRNGGRAWGHMTSLYHTVLHLGWKSGRLVTERSNCSPPPPGPPPLPIPATCFSRYAFHWREWLLLGEWKYLQTKSSGIPSREFDGSVFKVGGQWWKFGKCSCRLCWHWHRPFRRRMLATPAWPIGCSLRIPDCPGPVVHTREDLSFLPKRSERNQ